MLQNNNQKQQIHPWHTLWQSTLFLLFMLFLLCLLCKQSLAFAQAVNLPDTGEAALPDPPDFLYVQRETNAVDGSGE